MAAPYNRPCDDSQDVLKQDVLKSQSPMGRISEVQDIADAVLYLTEARMVTGEVLHVDGSAHLGKW